MTKSKKKKKDQEPKELKDLVINSATIKDDFCNYSYEVLQCIGIGDTHNVKGTGIIDPDLHNAFRDLNVHLAILDDVFKNKGIEVKNPNQVTNDRTTGDYEVVGFSIKGSDENERIILKGVKFMTASGGQMKLETPEIHINQSSSYIFWAELKEASDAARNEVEQYKNGKCTAVEKDVVNADQTDIFDEIDANLEQSKQL